VPPHIVAGLDIEICGVCSERLEEPPVLGPGQSVREPSHVTSVESVHCVVDPEP
jgi:hypothetical protein